MSIEEQPQVPHQSGLRKGVILTTTGSGLNIGLLFLETIIAVRVLSPDLYGVYALVITLVNFLVAAVDFGCRVAVTQMIASTDRARQVTIAGTSLVFRLIVVGAFAAMLWLGRDLILHIDNSPDMRDTMLFGAYIPLMLAAAAFDELFFGMLQGFQSFRHMAISQVIRSVLRVVITAIGLLKFDLGLMALIYSWIISFAISAIYQYLVLPIPKRLVFDRTLLVQMLKFGFPLQITRFLWLLFRRIDIVILSAFAGSASVAFYSVAGRIPDALQRLSESYSSVYFPTVTNLRAESRNTQADSILNHSLRLIAFGTGLLVIVALLFSQEIVTLLFSQKYATAAPAFGLLMMVFHMTFIVTILGYTLTAAGHSGRSLVGNTVHATLNVLGDLLLIPGFGFMGAVYAALIAVYVANPVNVFLLKRSGIAVRVTPYFKQTLTMLGCAGLFWVFRPTEIVYKTGIIVLYVLLNLALDTVSRRDARLVLPVSLTKRLGLAEGA